MKKGEGIYNKASFKMRVGLMEDDDGNPLMVYRCSHKVKGVKKYWSEYVYTPPLSEVRELKHVWAELQSRLMDQKKG